MNTKPNILARIQPSPHTLLKQIDGKGVMMVNFGRGEVKLLINTWQTKPYLLSLEQ